MRSRSAARVGLIRNRGSSIRFGLSAGWNACTGGREDAVPVHIVFGTVETVAPAAYRVRDILSGGGVRIGARFVQVRRIDGASGGGSCTGGFFYIGGR